MEATDIYEYLRAQANELGSRILEMYPPLQSMTDQVPAELSTLLRAPLPAQAIAIGGLAKHFRSSRAARIVAECGAGKTYMALGLGHILKARTILVMCPSHLGKKWAREAIQTIPFVREVHHGLSLSLARTPISVWNSAHSVFRSRQRWQGAGPGE